MKRLLLVIIVLLFARQTFAQETKQFTILHTNDEHGHILPFSFPDSLAATDDIRDMPCRKNVGGIARRATLIKQIRATKKNVYVFDAGDCLNGSVFSLEFHDLADYDAMNETGIDYAVYGNNDFDLTGAEFSAARKHAHFPLVLANVVKRGTDSTILPPYLIGNWDGLRVGVIGLVTKASQSRGIAQTAFTVLSPLEVAKKYVPIVRPQVDLLILVTHIGIEEDKQIAKEVSGIDIIVGGHSHTRLAHGITIMPDSVKSGDATQTIIVQDGHYTPELGELTFTTMHDPTGRWHVSSFTEELLSLTDKIKDDPATERVVKKYYDKIKGKYLPTLGTATAEFTSVDGRWTASYNLFADILKWKTNADLSVELAGSLRAPLLAGNINGFALGECEPYVDSVAMVTMTGNNLDSLISYYYPAVSDNVHYDNHHHKKTASSKDTYVVSNITIDDKPLDREHIYRVALSSNLLGSVRDNIITAQVYPTLILDAAMEYVKAKSTIAPQLRRSTMIEE
jgi:5'-nucleotidase/UDP-sugar diphosphatase